MPPLSVCVIACNEEDRLPRCLAALGWADEIVVLVDAKSSDATLEIARKEAHRVEVRAYDGDIEQKSHCVSLATHDWVAIVDADEVVSPELAAELRAATGAAGESVAGFEVNRLTYHLGRWIRYGDFFPDWTLRVFRRSRARWVGQNPHGRIVVDGSVRRLRAELPHYSYRDLADQLDRIQFFSGEAARALQRSGARPRLGDMILRPPARFLRAYILKRGFLDGIPGFIIAVATSFHVFLKYAKHWELTRVAQAADASRTDEGSPEK
jgi:glycosyltransferase involved in cell wall biosynthesis